MTKAPFVFEHTTKISQREGVTNSAGAQAAVRQPSTPASGRGDALEGGDSCAIPPPFQRREVGVRTSHTTAAERLSSTPVNRPICARFGVVARWDFQERARLILPNEDGDCKRFLRNLAAPSESPPHKCLGTVSGRSDSTAKRN